MGPVAFFHARPASLLWGHAMSVTNIDICAQACVMIGASPITSFEDGSAEAVVAANLYMNTMRDLLSRHRWRFATTQVQLSRLVDVPLSKWTAAYQLPRDCLAVSSVFVHGQAIDFDRFADNIYCDATAEEEVYLEGVFWVSESYWPPYFVQLAVLTMASLMAHGVAAQVETADYLDKKAQRQQALARHHDSQNQTARRFDAEGLIRGRSSIGRRGL